jgi:hypothetical protein
MLSDLLSLPFRKQFLPVFDAMFSDNAMLFSGLVTIGTGDARHTIPFTGRMSELYGQVLDTSYAPHESGGFMLTLTNVIESNLKIGELATKARYGDQLVDARIEGLELPLVVEAGATKQLVVKPVSAPPVGIAPALELTLDRVIVDLDRDAVLDSILVTDGNLETSSRITVKVSPSVFDTTAPDPLLALVVHFENTSVELTPTVLEREVEVSIKLVTLLRGQTDDRSYRYKVETVRRQSQQRDEQWRTDKVTILYIRP